MRILIAPDKLKSSLTANEAAAAIQSGILRASPKIDIDTCPLADGGEGTVDALVAATHGTFHTHRVTGPLPEMKVDARFGLLGNGTTAVIEMSSASGLALLKPEDRDPSRTTTFGTGELLMAAARLGVTEIILGIGGSATLDAGIGCAQACDLPVLLEGGEPLSPTEPLTGADLPRVLFIKHGRGSPIERIKITVACDVTNPLFGPNGAAAIFGPQKGARPEDIPMIDAVLEKLAKRNDKLKEANLPGAGAAGGLGFAMAAFFNATLRPGFDIVAQAVNLSARIAQADLCITSEGRVDATTFAGKTAAGVASLCRQHNVPCIAIAGSIDETALWRPNDFTAAISLCNAPMTHSDAITRAPELLEAAAERVTKIFLAGRDSQKNNN
jgi:glycerate 2-kinase